MSKDNKQFGDNPIDWASQRGDELAAEVQGWEAQAGNDIAGFGITTGLAVGRLLAAYTQIGEARDRLPDHKAIAFGLKSEDARLIKRATEYPLKSLIATLLATEVNLLIREAGRQDEFNNLWQTSISGSTPQLRRAALAKLHDLAEP